MGPGWCCDLVGDLVSPLLDGLDHLLHDGGLGDLPGGGHGVGGGLGQAQAVAHGSRDGMGVLDSGGSGGDSGSQGSASSNAGSVGVGEGSVEEDLSLGGGGGKGENNLTIEMVMRWGSLETSWGDTYRLQHGVVVGWRRDTDKGERG